MSVFPGVQPSHFILPRFGTVKFATRGFASNHATESGTFVARTPSKFEIIHLGQEQVTGEEMYEAHQVKGELNLIGVSLTDIRTCQLLSIGANQYFFNVANAAGTVRWWNFIENTAGISSPNGTSLLGMEPEFTLTDKERTLKCAIGGKIYEQELTYLLSLAASQSAGSSGGSSLGISPQMEFATEDYNRNGIFDVTVNGVTIGDFTAPKLNIKFMKYTETTRMIPLCGIADCSFECEMSQSDSDEIAAIITAMKQDNEVIISDGNGNTFTFTDCMSVNGDPTLQDERSFSKLVMKAKVPYRGITYTSTDMAFERIGY